MASRESEFKTLTEVGTLGRGKSKHRPRNDPDLYGGEYPFVQTGDVKHAPFYLTEYTQTYNAKGLAQSKLWPPGTLCITIAANIADTAILAIPACFPDSILGFTPHPLKADVRYTKYCLDAFRAHMEQISKGTTQDNLSMDKLLKLRFWFPAYELQQKIAALLTAYDDLIANNQRRIALLESMAEEIYREWFVRMRFPGAAIGVSRVSPPAGWSDMDLTKLASITYGFTFAGDRFSELEVGKKIIRIRDVLAGDSKTYTDEIADDKYIVRAGDLLIGMDGEFHMNHWVAEDAYLVQRTCRVAPKQERLRAYLAHALKAPISHYQQTIVGATVGHLGAKHLNAIKLLVPPEPLNLGLELLNELLDQRLLLSKQNLRLAKSRDALLPRLISGKLRVDHLDIQFPPSMQPPAEAVLAKALA